MNLKEQLSERMPQLRVLNDSESLHHYGSDWTKVYQPAPSAVAFPETTEEVSQIAAFANEHQVAIVPSGGRTGLAAGAVAAQGELVVSLERMRRMDPVDTSGMTLRVQAGAVTQAVHEHCEQHGLVWPVDFASKGSSQIGGNISTNAGGVKVIRYGGTRNWVLGLQVVLASGTVLELNGALEKNNTGLDLRQLFIGTEGTLGIISEATLKLAPVSKQRDVMLFAVADMAHVLAVFRRVRHAPFLLNAFEFFTDRCLARVQAHRRTSAPLQAAPFYALVEIEARSEDERDAWLSALMETDLLVDGTVAQNSGQARQLWELREGISESLSATGFPHKNDVALPVAALERFCEALVKLYRTRFPAWEVCLFGHIGDGNVHVNVMKPEGLERDAFHTQVKDLDAALFELVAQYNGSVSAEHGIGLLKKHWLSHTRSEAEIEIMRQIKQTLDPNDIMNPGKILD